MTQMNPFLIISIPWSKFSFLGYPYSYRQEVGESLRAICVSHDPSV